MATLILGVVGGLIGGFVGGPTFAAKGAMLGWSIGTTVGSVIDQSNMHYYTSDMGRTNDLRLTVASYGTSIPQCWGLTRVPGILIWGTDLVEHETDESSGGGGSGGPTVTTRVFSYTVSFAMAICRGEPNTLNTVKKIYADDIVVYDSSQPSSSNLINPRFYQGTEAQAADALIISSAGNTAIPPGSDNPAFRGTNYMVVQDMLLTNFGNRIPNFSIKLDTGTVYVSDVITDIVRQVGVDTVTQLDVSAVTAIEVTGLTVASRLDAKSAIQPILDAYHIDLIDLDGTIKAIPRGGAPCATLTFDDLGAQIMGSGNAPAGQRVTKNRASELSLPQRVDVGYYSPTTDLQQATQSSVRQSAKSQLQVSVSYPLTLADTEARQLAERINYIQWVERMKYAANVMPKWLELCPSDVVWLQTDTTGDLRRVRITEAEAGLMGEIRMKFVADDDAVLTQTTLGTTPTGGLPTSTPVDTEFFVWSGKELRDTDGISAGFYVAATGAAHWQGCTVVMSTDGGLNYTPVGTVNARSVFGAASTTLGNTYTPNGNGFDATEIVRVSVNGTLASTSEDEVLNGQGNYGILTQLDQSISNSTNYEVMGFADVSLVSAGVYDISDLLRSQRATLDSGHTNTDVFVQATSSLRRISISSNLVGQVVKVKCVSPQIDASTVTEQDVFIPTPTAPYVTIGGITDLANSLRTPYFRARGYIGGTKTALIDDTYFLDGVGTPGANHPGGVNDQYWEESSLSPVDISWRYDTPGTGYTMYLRINIVNATVGDITFNWWGALWDNALKARLDGSYIYNSGAWDTNGTATVLAGTTQLLEIFWYNNPNDYDPSDPGTGWFKTDAIQQGLTWSDAGK